MREYQLVSPSLDGILNHVSIAYEGISRPLEVLKLMDGPSKRGKNNESVPVVEDEPLFSHHEKKIIEHYFQDLFTVFMKRVSAFVVSGDYEPENDVTLMAMLQEMIKVKKLLTAGGKIQSN